MRILKQSTASTLYLGPFLDSTDGVTAKPDLTLSQADIRLWKEGGTTAAQKNEATTCTHRENGYYTCPINTTDTNTLGTLVVSCAESGALPVRQDYLIVPANVFDSWVLGTDVFNVDPIELGGSTSALARHRDACLAMPPQDTVTTTGFTPTTTEFEAATIATATADHWIGRRVYFTSGTLQYEGAKITDYALSGGGRGHFTVETLTSAPANGVTFVIA